ncbi:hypothetical protein COLO4_20002 [Corchorus olitorius]|uniref:Uncharacterized protein n=1 Tax=Corchorus olitorius TaxID=93759 RepID=A0A1R3J2G0_9ROSI|nr:hypothetical protein COLO4_20002 [Corchorus olitorius]
MALYLRFQPSPLYAAAEVIISGRCLKTQVQKIK